MPDPTDDNVLLWACAWVGWDYYMPGRLIINHWYRVRTDADLCDAVRVKLMKPSANLSDNQMDDLGRKMLVQGPIAFIREVMRIVEKNHA